mmetsp:Transcript_36906/g.95567  ORF Transcript_36906/g.95567 Transcript_36906/m.95567 type:complete len:189 (+) Transcript_36906:485-1051(+)
MHFRSALSASSRLVQHERLSVVTFSVGLVFFAILTASMAPLSAPFAMKPYTGQRRSQLAVCPPHQSITALFWSSAIASCRSYDMHQKEFCPASSMHCRQKMMMMLASARMCFPPVRRVPCWPACSPPTRCDEDTRNGVDRAQKPARKRWFEGRAGCDRSRVIFDRSRTCRYDGGINSRASRECYAKAC